MTNVKFKISQTYLSFSFPSRSMRAWTAPLAVAVVICSLKCLVEGAAVAPRISLQRLRGVAAAGEEEDHKGRKGGDEDHYDDNENDMNEEDKKKEERSVYHPQSKVLVRIEREACPQNQQDPLGQILNMVSHSILVTSLAVSLINNINNNNNNDNNNNNNNNNNNLNDNDLSVNVVNMNMNQASLRRGFRSVRGAGHSSRQSGSIGHHAAHPLNNGVLSGALEDASLPLLTIESSSNSTTGQSSASSLAKNVRIHFSSTHQRKAAENPWMQCVSWGVCVRLAQAASASPAAWVTENLAVSILEVEIGQFMTDELRAALRYAIFLGRQEKDCEPLKARCSWKSFTSSGILYM